MNRRWTQRLRSNGATDGDCDASLQRPSEKTPVSYSYCSRRKIRRPARRRLCLRSASQSVAAESRGTAATSSLTPDPLSLEGRRGRTPQDGGKYATAESMSKAQREISVSEFFAKNRHLLGFDNKPQSPADDRQGGGGQQSRRLRGSRHPAGHSIVKIEQTDAEPHTS